MTASASIVLSKRFLKTNIHPEVQFRSDLTMGTVPNKRLGTVLKSKLQFVKEKKIYLKFNIYDKHK